jgi:hypothetical protein
MEIEERPMRILHAFADTGVECHYLNQIGNVTRLGISPRNGEEKVVCGDEKKMPFGNNTFDLGLAHPPCTKFTNFAQLNKEKYGTEIPESIVPEATEEMKRVCDKYIIENKPEAFDNPDVILEGSMFNIKYKKKRAFITNFDLSKPPKKKDVTYRSEWKDNKYRAMKEKGYPNKRKGKEAKNASIPVKYLEWIISHLEPLTFRSER